MSQSVIVVRPPTERSYMLEAAALAVAFSPDGSRIAVSQGSRVSIHEASSLLPLCWLSGHRDLVRAVAFSADGRHLISGGNDGTLRVWDADDGAAVRTLEGHLGMVQALAAHPNASLVASGAADRTIRVWNVITGRTVALLEGHGAPVTSLAMSPEGDRLFSGSCDATLRGWDLRTGACTVMLPGHRDWVSAVACSPDGSLVASGSFDKDVRLFDARSARMLALLPTPRETIYSLCFDREGAGLLTGAKETIFTFSVEGRSLVRVDRVHDAGVSALACSPADGSIASVSWDRTLRVTVQPARRPRAAMAG